jgi:hypothetical protein
MIGILIPHAQMKNIKNLLNNFKRRLRKNKPKADSAKYHFGTASTITNTVLPTVMYDDESKWYT